MEWIVIGLFLVGIASAVLGSLVGLGGGVIIVPALIYFSPALFGTQMSPSTAVGTSLVVLIVTALAATMSYLKQKRVDTKSGWLFFAASGPAAMAGAALTNRFSADGFELAFGFFMLAMAGLLIARDYMKPISIDWNIKRQFIDSSGTVQEYGYNLVPALLCGAGVGFVSGLFGIGGGSLFVPIMVLLFRFPPHVAAATSMFVILFSAALGSGTKVWLGEVDWISVAALAPGAWIGGKIGAWIAARMSGNALLWLLRITLVAMAVRLIIDGFAG